MTLNPLTAGILFGLLGFAGNWLKYELFFNVDFLFGTSFVLFALLRFGPVAGIVSGVLASTCTWLLWKHPWAIVIFSAEAVFVSFSSARGRLGVVGSMVLFWLLPGPLLIWVFYRGVMHIPADAAGLIILKQGINAVLNALVAKCAHLVVASVHPRENERPTYREFLTAGMLALVLFPTLMYIVFDTRHATERHLEDARRRASHTARLARACVDLWISDHHEAVKALAASLAGPASVSPAEKQRRAEETLDADSHLLRVGVMDSNAVSVAYAPLRDELGRSTVGVDFSDRPYLPVLRIQRVPYVGDVQMGRIGDPAPVVPLLAPIVRRGVYEGYCGAILDLEYLRGLLAEIVGPRTLTVTVLDRNDAVITSTDSGRAMMTPLRRTGGELRRISADVMHWLPGSAPGISILQRWRSSYYLSELPISQLTAWKVLVEAPLLPALTDITATTIRSFTVMAGLILVLSGLSNTLSRWQSRPIVALRNLTDRVAGQPGVSVEEAWPRSSIREVDELSQNLRIMAESLTRTVGRLNALNAELETRVAQRTEELRKNEERLRLALSSARQSWFDLNVKTGEGRVDPESAKVIGYEPDEWETSLQRWTDNLHPADRVRALEAFRKCLETGQPVTMEYRRRMKDGSWRWISSTGQIAAFDADGKPLRMIGIHADITARTQAEETLRESEERFRNLFERVRVVALVIDPESGAILDANDAACSFYGWPAAQLRSMTIWDINTLTPAEVRREMEAARTEERSHFLFRHRRAGGSVSDVEVYSGPIPLKGKTVLYSIVHDITERKRAEAALRELNRTLEERVRAETQMRLEKERLLVQQSKMAAMGDMIGAIAHQWRQPLNAVGVIVQEVWETFEHDKIDRAYLRRAVDDAMAQVRFMSKTIDDFRNFYRPDKARTTFEIKEAVAEVCTMLSPQLRERQIDWSITCGVHGRTFGPGEPIERCDEMQVSGYPNEIKQVFLNLVANAKDSILERRRKPGCEGLEGRIAVRFDREGVRVIVRVEDNGGGIPEALLDRVFEPYFTTKEQGLGTGIGLYMAKMIIETNMGGRISARNTEGGAEFRIEL